MKQAVIRLAVLLVLLINQTLITIGWNPLPYSEDVLFESFSVIATVLMAVYAWWKNNSITKEAIKADAYLKNIKKG